MILQMISNLISKKSTVLVIGWLGISLMLIGCSNNRVPYKDARKGAISGPKNYVRSKEDGAPWWHVDVSKIPDAVPRPHIGPYKDEPYVVFKKRYVPMKDGRNYQAVGEASWYGTQFHGRNTANGEKYDLYGMTAAHKTLPLPTYVKVTNLANNKSVIVRVNDRGPFHSDRIIDLSFAAAKKLEFARKGVARVRVEGIDPRKWQAQNIQPKPLAVDKSGNKVAANSAKIVDNPSNMQSGLYLQVGAFGALGSAQNLVNRLKDIFSIPAFIVPSKQSNITLYRVRLGPFKDYESANKALESIQQNNLGTASLVQI